MARLCACCHCPWRWGMDGATMRAWMPWVVVVLSLLLATWIGIDRWLAAGVRVISAPLDHAWSAALPASGDDSSELIARLQADNAALRQRLSDAESILGRGATAMAMAHRLVMARIEARPLHAGRRFIVAAAGPADGAEVQSLATLGWSVAGRIEAVSNGSCLIRTLIDAEFRLPCRILIADQRFVEGVWCGTGRRDQCEVRWVEDAEGMAIPVGAPVVTAGGTANVPAGLVLGQVVTAERPQLNTQPGGHWRVLAKPARDVLAASDVGIGLRDP